MGVLLALASAAAFGACDFVAGVASRRTTFWWVTLVSLVASSLGAWFAVGIRGDRPEMGATLWALVAGAGAAVGATSLNRGYGRGEMAVAGPLSAVGAAALPALVGIFIGDRLPALGVTGILLALPAIWLMAGTGKAGPGTRAGALEGILAGVGFAAEFVGLERAGSGSGLWPVAVSQTSALVLVLVLVSGRRLVGRDDPRPAALPVVAGLLSLVATAAYFLAAQEGFLTVAAVLTSLYPGVTVGLAAVLLHERPGRRQVVGLVLGAVAVTFVSLG